MDWKKIEYPWTGIKIPDSEIESRMKLFDDFVRYFGFDRMARAESVGSYERLLYGKHSYNNVAGSCYYANGWKEPEDVPEHDHGLLFKKAGTSQIVYVNQPYGFDRAQLEEWCNERRLIYVICDKRYSFYYPDNTDMVLIMSNDTYISCFDLPHWPQRWSVFTGNETNYPHLRENKGANTMKEKLQIVQQMEELAGNIKRIEESLDAISKEDVEHIDNIRIQYIIPNERNYSGNGVRAMIRDVAFPIPDGKFADKIIACIRQTYEESLKGCYSLMEEYADKLKDTP